MNRIENKYFKKNSQEVFFIKKNMYFCRQFQC